MAQSCLTVVIDDLYKMLPLWRSVKQTPLVLGSMGIGKSETMKSESRLYSKSIGRRFVEWNRTSIKDKEALAIGSDLVKEVHVYCDLRTSQLEPSDLIGLPVPTGQRTVWSPPDFFAYASQEGASATLFLDEINLGTRSVQNACYQLILDRQIGAVSLAEDVHVVAAGNRAEDGAYVTPFADPLISRMRIVELAKPSADDWVNHNGDEPRIGGWFSPHPNSSINGLITGFLKAYPQMIHTHKKDRSEMMFADHRAWSSLSKLLSNLDTFIPKGSNSALSLIHKLASAEVGAAVALTLEGFRNTMISVDLDELFAHPEKICEYENKGNIDILYATFAGIATRVRDEGIDKTSGKPKGKDMAGLQKILTPALEVASFLKTKEYKIFCTRMVRDIVSSQIFNAACVSNETFRNKIARDIGNIIQCDFSLDAPSVK